MLTPEHRPSDIDFPLIQLAHLDSTSTVTEVDETVTSRFYSLHPIEVVRPPYGRLKASITCGTCQKTVRCTVYSDHTQRRWERRRIIRRWAALAMAVGALVYYFGFSGIHHHVRGREYWTWFVAVTRALPAATPVVLWFAGIRPSRTDGVRLRWSSRHSLRPAGSTHEVRRRRIPEPPEPNF